MGTYTSPNRVERDGFLVAFEGEAMTEAEATARGLISEGEEPVAEGFAAMTVAELKAYAAENDIDLSGASRKDDIVARIEEAEAEREDQRVAPEGSG